jgi:uncharacterized membrane protein YkvA (DUF1232 family)
VAEKRNFKIDKSKLNKSNEFEDILDCYVIDGEVEISEQSEGIFKKVLKGIMTIGNLDVLWHVATHPKQASKFFKPGELALIIGAVVYVIIPLDAIPDWLPLGYLDDIGVIKYALNKSNVMLNEYKVEFMNKKEVEVKSD